MFSGIVMGAVVLMLHHRGHTWTQITEKDRHEISNSHHNGHTEQIRHLQLRQEVMVLPGELSV